MKMKFKKVIATLLALIMILSTLAVAPMMANGASSTQDLENEIFQVWLDCNNAITMDEFDSYIHGYSNTTMAGAVAVHRRTSSTSSSTTSYYLFIPSTANFNELRFWYNGDSLAINGKEVENGGTTDALASLANLGPGETENISFKLGLNTQTVKCIRSSDVGIVYIDTESGSLSLINGSDDHSTYEGGSVMVVSPDGNVDYDGPMEKMQGRGNATWSKNGARNPYNIKLGTSASLLGMAKAKKWVLLANKLDPTLLRDQIGYDFSKYIGVKYQPICKPVDVYCNQIYMGSYQLSEKVEIKSSRIDVNDAYENFEIANGTVSEETGLITPADFDEIKPETKIYKQNGAVETSTLKATQCATVGNRKYSTGLNNPTDITGGYLYELEISQRWINENAGFCGYNRQGWVMKSADYATKDMVDYSYDLLYALGSAVYNNGTVPSKSTTTTSGATSSFGSGTTITNPAPAEKYQGKKWSDLLDAESAVKYFWTQEYFSNLDASTSSTYFYKDSDSIDDKLYAGPVWDLDHSMEKVCLDAGLNLAITVYKGRWGYNWTDPKAWYARNSRIYMWNGTTGNERASTDKMSPLSFYGALYNNNTDFQKMYNEFWWNTMYPASQILLGKDTDSTGTLKSIDEYFANIKYSAMMNNTRHELSGDNAFNDGTLKSGVISWFTDRNTFINGQIKQINMSNVQVDSIPNQVCTGSPIEPKLVLTYDGVTLQEGKNYTVEYNNNVNASAQATATITGIGYYTGSKTIGFTITQGELASAEIFESAYAGDTLTATVKTKTGAEVNNGITYQWKADGANIAGETSSTYEVKGADAGKNLTVEVSADGVNIAGTVTSNACAVATMERPTGFSKTISSWDYDFTANADALTTADETGAEYYYTATGGERIDGSELRASVTAKTQSKIKWSGTADLYANDEGLVNPDQAPVMGTSKTDKIAWADGAYFETAVSTLGYQSITFSAKIGGTKKAPRSWKLQYSLDGATFTDVEGSQYTITDNKTMEQAFSDVALPGECNNKSRVYIRAVVCEDIAINGINTVYGVTSGDAAINNVKVKGESIAVITDLEAPIITSTSLSSDSAVFDDEFIAIDDNNGGAKVYYTVDGGEVQAYDGKFNPFDAETAKIGDTKTITAWCEVGTVRSEDTVLDAQFAGVSISEFELLSYSKNVSNGTLFSTGGVYGESAKLTTYADGKSQYVPMWNDGNGALSIAPDDGAYWSADSGYYFEVPTAGYEDVRFTAQMYTTNMGPKSVSLQYSLDNKSWTDLDNTVDLTANGELAQAYFNAQLPSECDNKNRVFVRVVTVEDSTFLGEKLHKNMSKGNLYINNVVISGEDNGDYKMPYTNKTTAYFGTSPIKYHSPSGMDMQYIVTNPNGEIILSGTYQKKDILDENGEVIKEAGINIADADAFMDKDTGAYTVSIWAGDDDDRSLVNTIKYYYKGNTVVKFSYTALDKKRPMPMYYADTTGTVLLNTSGANSGELSMRPNGMDPTAFTYTDVYGVKVAWAETNPFIASRNLDKPAGNGYWLIKASTKGFKGLTFTAEQVSSNKGPRDWGIAYSLDGNTYKYVANSNARAISNDATAVPVETYNNFALPAELDDQDTVYIKLFINGGESVDGAELETLLKGNTGINNIEICGVPLPGDVDYTINTVAFEDENCLVKGTTPVMSYITIGEQQYFAQDGSVTITLKEGEKYELSASSNASGTFPTTASFTAKADGSKTVGIIALDVVDDGVINAKDYAMISHDAKYEVNRDYLRSIFNPFMNMGV